MCVCVTGGMDVWVISADERAKHDQQFLSLSPTSSGHITGETTLSLPCSLSNSLSLFRHLYTSLALSLSLSLSLSLPPPPPPPSSFLSRPIVDTGAQPEHENK